MNGKRHTPPIVLALTCPLLVALGCERMSELGERGVERPVVLEEVEVSGPPDSTLSTTTDRRAPQIGGPGVAGALPGGFPRDLPLYQPSSVVDFGEVGGERYVVFRAGDPPSIVRVALLAEWEQAGWRPAGGRAYRRGGEAVGLELTDSSGSTEIRISY